MKVIDPYFEILHMAGAGEVLRLLELAGRTCYKSEDRITDGSSGQFVKNIVKSGHESVIEHVAATVKVVCDRGVSHEIVRHRLCSFSQESTRYANYSKDKFGNEITVIRPFFFPEGSPAYQQWEKAVKVSEAAYLELLQQGARAQEARSVLPNSLKTEIVITANMREWRHIFELRCAKASHPQMRQVMLPLLAEFHSRIPVLFETAYNKYAAEIAAFQT